MVGIVVLGGLITLAWMLLRFGASFVSPFAPPFIKVQFVADRAEGISNGSAILYRGVTVGRVERVVRMPDGLHVAIEGQLDREPPLPANLRAVIRAQGLVGGGASLNLELVGEQPQGVLADKTEIPTTFIGLDLLPDEFTALATELRLAIRQFRETGVVEHIDQQVQRIGQLVDSTNSIVSDPKLREDLRNSLENIRSTTERTDRLAANLEKFSEGLPKLSSEASGAIGEFRTTIDRTQQEITTISKQVNERLAQMATILDRVQQITDKVNSGQGTAGALVNDRELYASLVDTAKELSATTAALRRLLEQWEQEGLPLKLK
jgi:phospholipid/cholesterol/gamma-HCH transport system substrate-binding protein